MGVNYGQWYVISGADLKAALDRVAAGDDPGIVLAEIYANSETTDHPEADHG